MAVEARYYSTRDPKRTMFADKKDADAHDRLLEATEEVAAVIERAGVGLDADAAYAVATAIVEHRVDLMSALKKAPKAGPAAGPGLDADSAAGSGVPEARPAPRKPASKARSKAA